MTKTFNLTLAAGFLAASTLLAPAAFAQNTFPGGDQAETNAVQSAIDKDPWLRADQVHAQTIDGVVYLHGHVGSQNAEDRAEKLAHSVTKGGEVVDTLSDDQFQG
jgi:hypothetical protein